MRLSLFRLGATLNWINMVRDDNFVTGVSFNVLTTDHVMNDSYTSIFVFPILIFYLRLFSWRKQNWKPNFHFHFPPFSPFPPFIRQSFVPTKDMLSKGTSANANKRTKTSWSLREEAVVRAAAVPRQLHPEVEVVVEVEDKDCSGHPIHPSKWLNNVWSLIRQKSDSHIQQSAPEKN